MGHQRPHKSFHDAPRRLPHPVRPLRGALLFNILSFLSDRVLSEGNTVAVLDELHVWLSNPTAIEYIRGMLKRCRKKDSSLIMASQNIEDFVLPGVAEMTKPLFSIPTHQFLFNAGSIDRRFFMDNFAAGRGGVRYRAFH